MRFMKTHPVLKMYSYGKLNFNFGRCSAGGSDFVEQSSLYEATSFLASPISRLYENRISAIPLTRFCHRSLTCVGQLWYVYTGIFIAKIQYTWIIDYTKFWIGFRILCGIIVDKIWTFLTLRRLMSYIYGAPILDVSRSHTTTQHSR